MPNAHLRVFRGSPGEEVERARPADVADEGRSGRNLRRYRRDARVGHAEQDGACAGGGVGDLVVSRSLDFDPG